MSSFSSQCVETAATPPDPRKHVNYTQGMVLGVDDLQQEFVYHQYQNQWLARDAIGYGTLSGLKVAMNGTEISVAPGAALSPRGQLIRVAPRQCASLDAWLRLPETQQRLMELGVGAASTFTVYVVLCFRDCKTDPLPIPGEPCRCDSEATAASRMTDDFRLELRLEPPAQREENAIRDFVEWLRQVRTTSADSGYASLSEFLTAIRTAAHDLGAPLESPPDYLYGSPPETLVIPCCHLCEYLRAALHLWVTELRPIWQAKWSAKVGGGCGCHGEEHDESKNAEECLLLAGLHVSLGGTAATVAGVQVDESRRPLVVHLRMLQELSLCGRNAACCNDRTFATLFALDQNTLRIWIHYPGLVTFDEKALSLEINGQTLSDFTVERVDTSSEPDSAFHHNVFDIFLGESPLVPLEDGQRIVARFDTRLIAEDVSPPRTLAEAIRQGCICFPDLTDDFITLFAAAALSASSLILQGDTTGPVHSNTVEGIQNIPVDVTSGLVNNTALGFDNNQWHPVPVPQKATTTPLPDVAGGAVGNSLDYARADHQHPPPSIPAPANTIPKPVITGTPVAADIGTVISQFALADHIHRLGRVQLGHIAVNPDPVGSDVRGILEHNIVVGLQGKDLPPPSGNGTALVFRGGVLGWEAKDDPANKPFILPATTGLVEFPNMVPSEIRVSADLRHNIAPLFDPITFTKYRVCIRLGLVLGPADYNEDTFEFIRSLNEKSPAPVFMSRFDPLVNEEVFTILVRDLRTSGGETTWRIRWYAIPVQEQEGIQQMGPNDFLPDELRQQINNAIIDRVGTTPNSTTASVANFLGLAPSVVEAAVTELIETNRLTRNPTTNRLRIV